MIIVVGVNIVKILDSEHQIKKWRAHNGWILDIKEIMIYIINTQAIFVIVMKRWVEVEHGPVIETGINDNDHLITMGGNTVEGNLERIFPEPITTKFLSMGTSGTIVAGKFKVFINGVMRKMTQVELATEIAGKNS